MTTETKDQPKQVPDFYVYEKDTEGNNKLSGVVFNHRKGGGFIARDLGMDYSEITLAGKRLIYRCW